MFFRGTARRQEVFDGRIDQFEDTVSYLDSTSGVRVELNNGGNGVGRGGFAEGDQLIGIQNLVGSNFRDILTGDRGDNRLAGGDGHDILHGGRELQPKGGKGAGGSDVLSGNDFLSGGAGNDRLIGGVGADTLDGGTGRDLISYEESSSGVSVSLDVGRGWSGEAQGDIIRNVEDVAGSQHGDVIVGSDEDNRLFGGAGADDLYGGQGDDRHYGGAGDDLIVTGGGRSEYAYGGADNDRLFIDDARLAWAYGGTGHDTIIVRSDGVVNIRGGTGSDTFQFHTLGSTRLFDFEPGVDKLDFSRLGVTRDEINVQNIGNTGPNGVPNDVSITFGGQDGSIFIPNGNLNGISFDDLIF